MALGILEPSGSEDVPGMQQRKPFKRDILIEFRYIGCVR